MFKNTFSKRMIKVKSITDVITNSSTEVFILKLTKKEAEWLENKRQADAQAALKRNKEDKKYLDSLDPRDRKKLTSLDYIIDCPEECTVVLAPCFTRQGLLWGIENKDHRKNFWVNGEWEYIREIIGGAALTETDEQPDFRSLNKWLADNMDWIAKKMKDVWLMEVNNYNEKIYDKLGLWDAVNERPKIGINNGKVLFYESRH